MRNILIGLVMGVAGLPTAVWAQSFTTAAEVKPILQATKPGWIAVREYDGQDLLYFTNALAWRCGLSKIRYGLNGAAADTVLPMEPCYDAEPAPNVLKMDRGVLIYQALPLQSVQSISVVLEFDDGTTEAGDFVRAAVLTP